MLTQSREAAAGGKSFEETLGEVAQDILERLPANFDIEAVEERCPQDYFNSMNTVLVQVRGRISTLIYDIRNVHDTSFDCRVTSRRLLSASSSVKWGSMQEQNSAIPSAPPPSVPRL